MKPWKVILATLVIFTAGLVTGMVTGNLLTKKAPQRLPPPLQGPNYIQKWFLGRMTKELALTPQQVKNLDKIFAESRERIHILWDMLGPEMQAELTDVQDKIKAQLTPEQQTKFEELRKSRSGRAGGPPGAEHRPRGRSQGPGSGSRRDGSSAQAPSSGPRSAKTNGPTLTNP